MQLLKKPLRKNVYRQQLVRPRLIPGTRAGSAEYTLTKVLSQVRPRLIPGTQAWWEMRARQVGFRDMAHAREQHILGAGFKSVGAYERFARMPKRTASEYYRALAEAQGKTVPQVIAEIRQRQLRKGMAQLR